MKAAAILVMLLVNSVLYTQVSLNQYGLYIIRDVTKLQQTITADSNKAFVRIKDFVPGVVLDIKYATTQNVFYEKLYHHIGSYTRLPVDRALAAV